MARINENCFFIKGVSYKTVPLEIREKLSFDCTQCRDISSELKEIPGIKECVVLSTCNRMEIYFISNVPECDFNKTIEKVLLSYSGISKSELPEFYLYCGIDAIEHLFRVTSGLESMILGEPQIFGQVKDAYSAACDARSTGPSINRLFHNAFRVGKIVRNETGIGEGAVSVSFAAVELAKKVFNGLKGRSVLLLGAGEIGELCAQSLYDSGVGKLYIANRTKEKADEIAGKLQGESVKIDDVLSLFGSVDIVITSISSKEPLIKKEMFSFSGGPGNGKPLVIIDLGVPRNVDKNISDIPNIILYDIDSLEDVAMENICKRKNEAKKAEEIISSEVDNFCSWLSEREIIPVIKELHDGCEKIRLEELDKVRTRMDDEDFKILEITTRRIVRKILHNPVISIRDSVSGDERQQLINSVQKLFTEKWKENNKKI